MDAAKLQPEVVQVTGRWSHGRCAMQWRVQRLIGRWLQATLSRAASMLPGQWDPNRSGARQVLQGQLLQLNVGGQQEHVKFCTPELGEDRHERAAQFFRWNENWRPSWRFRMAVRPTGGGRSSLGCLWIHTAGVTSSKLVLPTRIHQSNQRLARFHRRPFLFGVEKVWKNDSRRFIRLV